MLIFVTHQLNNMSITIDFSAHDAWLRCPAYWYELYVNNRRKRWPTGRRNDALCLGSLVHSGLEQWQVHHRISIPDEIIEEVTPDQETLALASELIYGYTRAYPEEAWPLVQCEEPLQFPLAPEINLLSKLDQYFFVPETTEIASGVGELRYTLTRGWWIYEYKTRSSYIPMNLWLQDWEMKLQASYQLLALQEHLRDQPEPIGGLLVNVLEKPRRTTPKRKCKTCNEYYEFNMWVPTTVGYRCPICNTEQKLQPIKNSGEQAQPAYYRVAVTRTEAELEFDRDQILRVAGRMQAMRDGGLTSEVWNKSRCVDMQYKRACDYFASHKGGLSTCEDDLNYFTPTRDYRGLIQLET